MKPLRLLSATLVPCAVLFLSGCGTPGAPKPSHASKIGPRAASAKLDPLRTWTDKTAVKLALIDFVEQTAMPDSSRYVPPAERIAVFSAEALLPAGATRLADPLRELLSFLAANGYRSYVVTDGSPGPLRAVSRERLDLAPDRIIGAYPEADYVVENGRPAIVPRPGPSRTAKPVLIHRAIGQRPVLAFGATDADEQMLEYTTLANPRASAAFVIPSETVSSRLRGTAKTSGWPLIDPRGDW